MKTVFIILLVLSKITVMAGSYDAVPSLHDNKKSVDTVKVIYYLDGKQVPFSTIREKGQKGELGSVEGQDEPKHAIRQYGEKFRNGVLFASSVEGMEEKEADEPYDPETMFQLNGKIDSRYDGKQIMLFTFRQDTIHSVDTAVVQNGTFRFLGDEYVDDFSLVSIGNYPDKVLSSEVILNKGSIYLEFDTLNRVWGGELNDKFLAFRDSIESLYTQMRAFDAASQHDEYARTFKHHMAYTYDFMVENQRNLLGLYAFNAFLGHYTLEDPSRFEELCDWFDKERKSAVVKRELRHKELYAQRQQSQGDKYIDFELQTPSGETERLSDYVGKSEYIFIDFWASWCGPCIADMPYLKKVYEKYKDKGLEVIGISIDHDKKSWLKALERVDAPWRHLSDLKGKPSPLTEAYRINEIPYGILLNKEGSIIATNLRGLVLDEKMQELIGETE
ncbi:TlpA disulfide reductase family protein [Parabacteroides sp. PF5-6]|uniref:TlpA disulfide reductase family protein n=1 Tax=Parabacteroides sp. PF5-6 TaxID=1742403 RepID=UPI00240520DC|nr:TlpA disulfide reductase family protein [Parabacteroides sp. PF5-6]